MRAALTRHWPEYLIEAASLGSFMVSASLFAVLLFHPRSPLPFADSALTRRALMGLAMALTAIALIYSPWGRRSGAHFNPAVTLTFFRLGKVEAWDAAFYVAAQFVGGVCGMLLVAVVARPFVGDPAVNYVVTVPGSAGVAVAFTAEVVIAFCMMTTVLAVSNSPRWAGFTGLCAGALVAAYITIEAPLSGILEILQFPPDKGNPRWQRPSDSVFLGIDHTAIVVDDTDRSLAFYRDALGMRVVGESENYGPEQARLNNVSVAHLRITTLRAESGLAIELLQYLAPLDGRPLPADARPNDLVTWQTRLTVGDAGAARTSLRGRFTFLSPPTVDHAFVGRDPDGHLLVVRAQP